MAILKPIFELTVGSFRSTTEQPARGPSRMVVERDMDVPADSLEVSFMLRPDVNPGDAVTLALGHDDSTDTVFVGEVAEIEFAPNGVRLTAIGSMNALLNLRIASSFEGRSAGSIVQDLVSAAGLEAGLISDGPTLPAFTLDRGASGWHYLRSLADRLGYEFYADREGRVRFHALGAAAELDSIGGGLGGIAAAASAALGPSGGTGYSYGQNLLSLSAFDRSSRFGAVEVGGESPMSQAGDTTVAYLTANDRDHLGSAGDGQPSTLLRDAAARTKDLADRFAAGALATANRDRRRCSIAVLGRSTLDLGDSIGTRDAPHESGNVRGYVCALRHRFSAAGFVTDVRIAVGDG